jgi:SAM-dependent methyltransferase
MATVSEHYQQLLSKHYLWMFGTSFEDKVNEQRTILTQALKSIERSAATPNSLAVDLGCGPGFQTIALAQMGFSPLVAFDTSAELLDELRSRAHNFPLQIEQADLLTFQHIVRAASAAVIVCMGDTVTHLRSKADVSHLFQTVHNALAPGGVFVITYRDLTPDLHGAQRFLPVRSDDDTIMTCFLEYTSDDTVIVHDLIYTRQAVGWTLNASSYPKLRLPIAWLAAQLAETGLIVESQGAAGRLLQIVARKP